MGTAAETPFTPDLTISVHNVWDLGGDSGRLRAVAAQLAPTSLPPVEIRSWTGAGGTSTESALIDQQDRVEVWNSRVVGWSATLNRIIDRYDETQQRLTESLRTLATRAGVRMAPDLRSMTVTLPGGDVQPLVDSLRIAQDARRAYGEQLAQLPPPGPLLDPVPGLTPVLDGTAGDDDYLLYLDESRGIVEIYHSTWSSGVRGQGTEHITKQEVAVGTPILVATGDGNDNLIVGPGLGDLVTGGLGGGDDVVEALSGVRIGGGTGDDLLHVAGYSRGPVALDGGAGRDTLLVGMGIVDEVRILGGDDGDVLYTDSPAILDGGAGNDGLFGSEGADLLLGGEGVDKMYGWRGDDVLDGGAGTDDLYGGSGRDRLTGGADQDVLNGGAGDDHLAGDDGGDLLFGGGGADDLAGGVGDDVVVGGRGADTVDGGTGADRLITEGRDRSHEVEETRVQPENDAGRRLRVIDAEGRFGEPMQDTVDLLVATPYGNQLLTTVDQQADQLAETLPGVVEPVVRIDGEGPQAVSRMSNVPGTDRIELQVSLDLLQSLPEAKVGTLSAYTFHELSHSEQFQRWLLTGEEPDSRPYLGSDPIDFLQAPRDERLTVGLPVDQPDGSEATDPRIFTENGFREELGLPIRKRYVQLPE